MSDSSNAAGSCTDRRRPRRPARKSGSVIFASSLGTVFEWYDFYLYATLAPFFAATVLSAGQRDGGAAVGLRGLRRGLPGAPVRRPGVRPPGRPGRPQIHLPRHHPVHGRLDLRGRPAADLLVGRLARAGADGVAAPASRAWRWAASMAVRRPTSPSMRRAAGAATPRAGSRPRRRSASSCRSRSSRSAAPRWTPRRSPTGAGASRSWCR